MNQFYKNLLTIATNHLLDFSILSNSIHIISIDTFIMKDAQDPQDFKTASQVFHALESIVYNSVPRCQISLEHANESYAVTIYDGAYDQEAIGGSTRSYAGAIASAYANYIKGDIFLY